MKLQAGLAAEFAMPEALLSAVRALRAQGLTQLDAFTPWPVKGLDEALALPRSHVPRATLAGGLLGAVAAYGIQWWTNASDYVLNVGSRPAHAAAAFIPITFETMVLGAGLSAAGSMLYFCGLPELWSPIFETPGIESASRDRFWVAIDGRDPRFDQDAIRVALRSAGALRVESFGASST